MKIVRYQDTDSGFWDLCVTRLPKSSFAHTYDAIKFVDQINPIATNVSQLLFEDNGELLAALTLFISKIGDGGKRFSIGNHGCPRPLINPGDDSTKLRRNTSKVIEFIEEMCFKESILEVLFIEKPVSLFNARSSLSKAGSFELINFGFDAKIYNNIHIDLKLPEEQLFKDCSKYRQKSIKKCIKQGQKINIINSNSDIEQINSNFLKFQFEHKKVSSHKGYPPQFYEILYQHLINSEADLLVTLVNGLPISFLYCRSIGELASGSIAVNLSEYEVEYSPRHYLEWSAILHYKYIGKEFYEVGIRYIDDAVADKKLITISDFKERYGGILLPEIHFTKSYHEGLSLSILK